MKQMRDAQQQPQPLLSPGMALPWGTGEERLVEWIQEFGYSARPTGRERT